MSVQSITVTQINPTAVVVVEREPVVLTPQLSPQLVLQPTERERVLIEPAAAPIKQVNVPGMQGPQGIPGAAATGDATAVIAFAFGDASPRVVFVATDDRVIPSVRVIFDTPFDGVGSGVAVGVAGNPELYMSYAGNDPAVATAFESEPDLTIPANMEILLSIRPGSGASKGAGRLLLTAYPT